MEVKSELYEETDFSSVSISSHYVISKFRFSMPSGDDENNSVALQHDNDNDLLIRRRKNEFIEIEHKKCTILSEVGLQPWRGAFLLNDFILCHQKLFTDKTVLELGAGVGLTSIIAAMFANRVLCTDINIGGILDLIKKNLNLNRHYRNKTCSLEVYELDFFANRWNEKLEKELKEVDVCFAADVIYDDDITRGFIKTILRLFKLSSKLKEMYIALEKRYVFTENICAPMYEFFTSSFAHETAGTLRCLEISKDFPQYFEYQKCKELVLLRVERC